MRSTAFERLSKILALEQQQGHRNKAVIGGLDKFASHWQQEAEAEAPKQVVAEIVALLMGYPTLMEQQARERLIREVINRAEGYPKESPGNDLGEETSAESFTSKAALAVSAPSTQTSGPSSRPTSRHSRSTEIKPEPAGLVAPVTRLPGIGQAKSQQLEKLGVSTVGDLLYLLPRRYDDYSALKTIDQLQYGEEITIVVNLWDIKSRKTRGGNLTLIEAVFSDGTGTLQVTWFNQDWLRDRLRPGQVYRLSGKVEVFMGRHVMNSPQWESADKQALSTGRIVPVYPLTEGISAPWMRRTMSQTVSAWASVVSDPLPQSVRERVGLLDLARAIDQIHFPDNHELLAAAQRRLAFDEFFLIQLGALRQRATWQSQPGRALQDESDWLNTFRAALPYQLTAAQERVLQEIVQDIGQPRPMSRLLQGDVGSGKTVVAAAAMWLAARNGMQAALMAPTQILAEQHYRNLSQLFSSLPGSIRVALLTGNLKASEKESVRQAVAAGEVQIVIGTVAIIQEDVAFRDLALAVVDEQHRFGVEQRTALRQKGYVPHVLVMSATPIPRTLALTLYGDLDISTLDEMPPGRQSIKTRWIKPSERERAYTFIRKQIEQGRQTYIIYPLIEESEALQVKAAVNEYERLQKEIFPDLRLGLLHGRLKGQEKDEGMRAFSQGDLDILVSTAVVEVGIDVPNATVMMIEGAERFGLSQLHQFRGRVGRGEHPSYCILATETASGEKVEQLRVLEESLDGFVIAQKDLELRGPGDFIGTRQSGLPELRAAKLSDVRGLEVARNEAQTVYAEDPNLEQPEHQLLARRVEDFWRVHGELS